MASFFELTPPTCYLGPMHRSPQPSMSAIVPAITSTTSNPRTSTSKVGSTVALETVPGALTKEYKNKRLTIVNINETITKEFSQKIAHQINEAANPAVSNLVMEKFGHSNSSSGSTNPIIFITIDSNGGSIYESLPILEAMRRAKAAGCIVITVINAIAFSCAFAIFASGANGYRFVNPQAKMLVHQPTPKTSGVSKKLGHGYSPFHPVPRHSHENDEDQKHLDHLQQEVLAALIGAIPSDELKAEFLDNAAANSHKNWYLYAKDALYYGIADLAIVPDFVHHVTYTPMLHLGGGQTLEL